MSRRKPSARWPGRFAAAALILALQAAVAFAGPTARFDIPAQPMPSALRALASQAGVQLVFTPETVGAAQGAALTGEMSVEAALERLLAGSGLKFRQEGERNYVVVKDAQPARESTLSEMVVTATRTERRVDEVPASVSVITGKDLAQQRLHLPEEALRNVEGIDFNTSDSSAFSSTPQIRGIGGSFAGQTSAVLVNGMATDSFISSVAGRGGFGFLAAQDIDRIEVVRGPASALYGPNVVGGVINVIPKRWRGDTGAEVSAEIGSHDSRAVGAAIGTSGDLFDIRLSAYDSRTDGFVAKPDADPWGDKDIGPRGWHDSKINLNGAIYAADDQEIGFSVQQFRTKQNYVGGAFPNSEKRDGDAYTLSYQKEFIAGHRIKLSYRHLDLTQSWIDDPDYGMGVGSRKSKSDIFEAQADARLSDRNTLIFGVSRQSADFETVSISDGYRDTSSATMTGIFVQDEHRFGDLIAIVGGRFDRFDQKASYTDGVAVHQGTTENVFNPRLGLRYRVSPATSLYASAGTAYLPANADFKYRNNPARWKDNPDLKPETSTTYEIGANHNVNWGSFRAAIYHTDYQDMISSMSVGATPWPRQFVNIGQVAVDGLEIGFDGRLPGGWRPYANYAYTNSIIKENPSDPQTVDKHIQRIAPHKFNLGIGYAPSDAWSAAFAGRYVGERFFTDRNTSDRRASGYFVADAKITAKLPASFGVGHLEAYLAINNVFDKKYTVWEYEYADRRNIWLGLNAKF